MLIYEELLNRDSRWALSEGSRFFEKSGAVQDALHRITRRLDELSIPYAVAGGMALFEHGFRRFTEDIDILVTPSALQRIHCELEGRGYLPPFAKSKNLRDTQNGVRIEFLLTGGFPGDGKPKPVAFPDPEKVGIERNGIRYVSLPALVELKLASGMSSPHRGKDLDDVQALIETLVLPREFADSLNPFVQNKYHEIWQLARSGMTFFLPWTVPQPQQIRTIDDIIAASPDSADRLQAMKSDGVTVDASRAGKDYVYLATSDPEIAVKYDMHPADEYMDDSVDPNA